jgi:uncharacterized protein
MMLDAELLEILVCPKCKGDLAYDEEQATLTCSSCRLRYEVRADIPVLLIDEAQAY